MQGRWKPAVKGLTGLTWGRRDQIALFSLTKIVSILCFHRSVAAALEKELVKGATAATGAGGPGLSVIDIGGWNTNVANSKDMKPLDSWKQLGATLVKRVGQEARV